MSALPAPQELSEILAEDMSVIVLAQPVPMVPPALLQRLAHLGRIVPSGVQPFVPSDTEALRRLLLTQSRGAERQLIAAASLENHELVVWSCEPRELRCPVWDIPVLKALPKARLKKFALSPSGSRLRWPDEDIDLNLDTFRELVDPEVLQANQERFRREAKRHAEAIKALRKSKGLRQDQIAGLSERQVRRLESGEVYPHSSTLNKLAAAHGLPPAAYVRQLAGLGVDAV